MKKFKTPFDSFEFKSSDLKMNNELKLNSKFYSSDVTKVNLNLKEINKTYPIKKIDDFVNNINRPNRLTMNEVSESEGVPYLSPKETFSFPFQPKKYVIGFPDDLEVKDKQLLITCSGSVGRCLIANKFLKNFVISSDMIKISAPEKYLGYIYAYLSCSFGQTLISKEQYGSTVKHVNPEHIKNIPIPYISNIIDKVNSKILESQYIREEAYFLLSKAKNLFYKKLDLNILKNEKKLFYNDNTKLSIFCANSIDNNYRIDAPFNNPIHERALKYLYKKEINNKGKMYKFEDFTKILLPNRFKRNYVDKKEGIPFLQGSHISQIKPQELKYIWKKSKNINKCLIQKNWILMTRSGTTGKISLVSDYWNNWAASDHLIRIIVDENKFNPGYVAMFLMSDYGQVQLDKFVYGAVVDEIGESGNFINQIEILKPVDKNIEDEIGNMVIQSYNLRDKANKLEDSIIQFLEQELCKLSYEN